MKSLKKINVLHQMLFHSNAKGPFHICEVICFCKIMHDIHG